MNKQNPSAEAQEPIEEQGFSQEDRDDDQRAKLVPSRFSLVCESLDGKLCLFEDADGHLSVVRTDRLA